MTTQTKLMTAEELFAMPDDGYHRYELVRGELRKMSPPGAYHGKSSTRVGRRLADYVDDNDLGEVYIGEVGFLIGSNPDHVRAPDVAFVRQEREDEVGEIHGYFPGAPDLAISVISPNDRYTEVDEKVNDWLEAGTRMVIVINPRRREVRLHRPLADTVILVPGDTPDSGEVVPGWTIPVSAVFP